LPVESKTGAKQFSPEYGIPEGFANGTNGYFGPVISHFKQGINRFGN
jgi:hypothetical protein